MKTAVFIKRSRMPAPADAVFRWHARPGAFERLGPPWESVEIVERTGGIEDGAGCAADAYGAGVATLDC